MYINEINANRAVIEGFKVIDVTINQDKIKLGE